MIDSIISALDGIPKELIIFIISMFPVLELRGGMIAASLLGVPWTKAFAICVIGNMIPIPLILLFIRQIFVLLKKVPFFNRLITKIEAAAGTKAGIWDFSALSQYRCPAQVRGWVPLSQRCLI